MCGWARGNQRECEFWMLCFDERLKSYLYVIETKEPELLRERL